VSVSIIPRFGHDFLRRNPSSPILLVLVVVLRRRPFPGGIGEISSVVGA
jgi:hypothetical protein